MKNTKVTLLKLNNYYLNRVMRSFHIENVFYTISEGFAKMDNLANFARINNLKL